LVGSLKLQVSFAKEPYKRDDILQKRLMILRSLLIVATPQQKFPTDNDYTHISQKDPINVCRKTTRTKKHPQIVSVSHRKLVELHT